MSNKTHKRRRLWAFCYLALCSASIAWMTIACDPKRDGCTSHAFCKPSLRCVARIDTPPISQLSQDAQPPDASAGPPARTFACLRHCTDSKECKRDERCIQVECITPRKDCWGTCIPKEPTVCKPSCDKDQRCESGRCIDAPREACPPTNLRDQPASRVDTMGIFDTKRAQVVMFGGDLRSYNDCELHPQQPFGANDLWLYDPKCARFGRSHFKGKPQALARGTAVYDAKGDAMLVLGGRSSATNTSVPQLSREIWRLDLKTKTWISIIPDGEKPAPRSGHAAVWNHTTGELLLFGGDTSQREQQYKPQNDLWRLKMPERKWHRLTPMGESPKPRRMMAAAWDEKGQRLFVFAGSETDQVHGPYMNDLWVWKHNTSTWALLHDGTKDAPKGRYGAAMIYDATAERLVMFGGYIGEVPYYTNDTWSFQLKSNTWEQLIQSEPHSNTERKYCVVFTHTTQPNLDAPERRANYLSIFNPVRREWLIFGGRTECGTIDDLWSFDLYRDEWLRIKVATRGESCPRGPNPDICKNLCQ